MFGSENDKSETAALLPLLDWIPLGRKIQKYVHDCIADEELAVDRQEGRNKG